MTKILFARMGGVGLSAAALTVSLALGPALAQNALGPDGSSVQPSIKLVGVVAALPVGTTWLSLRTTIFCSPYATLTWSGGREPQDLAPFAETFKTEMERAGYKAVTPGDNLFDPEAVAADYQAAAVITDERVDACITKSSLIASGGIKGSGAMKIDWQIYSPIKKQVVARVSTSATASLDESGSVNVEQFASGKVPLQIQNSFAANIRQLAASTDFRSAMNAPKALTNGFVMPGQQSRIALAGSLKAKPQKIADAVGSVVTLLVSDGTGSGVLVSDDGYLLTNAHVVGDDKTVRVRWSDNIETLGQVIRVAKDRDVAVIKTNARERTPFAIKRGALAPGQKVYAIGSPAGPNFQGTVTSGIVSTSTRIMDGLRYIQSDVMVSFGSSGGALLDENGSLIGLTDLGVPNHGENAGLNLFIPIGDAMDFLSLDPQ